MWFLRQNDLGLGLKLDLDLGVKFDLACIWCVFGVCLMCIWGVVCVFGGIWVFFGVFEGIDAKMTEVEGLMARVGKLEQLNSTDAKMKTNETLVARVEKLEQLKSTPASFGGLGWVVTQRRVLKRRIRLALCSETWRSWVGRASY